ncbi:SusD/RagB family nutrient-binding outer membrane lipoprotein [Flavihumibacter sp. R14]|nr:SusD/RagB family nutrient-binding outer membrane lipoprotein [Flavihumibacter soli]
MKKTLSIIACALVIGFTACKEDFLNLDENPNVPSTATPQLLLSGALKITADIVNTGTTASQSAVSTYGIWMGYWTPSGSYVPNSTLNNNNFTNTHYQTFTPLYNNASNYQNLINLGAADPTLVHFEAIGMIMKAFDFQALVDTYNNVPYSDAFKATASLNPKYDKGEAIYDDLLIQLTEAIGKIKGAPATAVNPGRADIMYKGNMDNWVKFANTLKLRIALRQWNKLAGKQSALKTAIDATAANGFIDETSAALANPGYISDDANGGKQSPFWYSYGVNAAGALPTAGDYYKANAYAVTRLQTSNDPRLSRFYAPLPSDGTTFKGNIYGATNTSSGANTSSIGPGLLKAPTMDAVIMSVAEGLFLQSEAVLNGLIAGDAKSLYERGITASFVQTVVPNAAAAALTYYNQPIKNINWDASPDKLEAIINQKWTSLNGYGNMEAYNEYRRTGFPLDVPVSLQSVKPVIPTRVFYPNTEYQQNAVNVTAEGTIDQFASKIFWAK